MPHSEVTKIELRDNKITLTIKVLGLEEGTIVEISGQATQANGAIATFHDVQKLLRPKSPGTGFLVKVTADSSAKFGKGEVITVAGRTRAAKIWGTVLHEDKDEKRQGITVWKAERKA
jgi:hypothetical protein